LIGRFADDEFAGGEAEQAAASMTIAPPTAISPARRR
jgi:hypothetical protein